MGRCGRLTTTGGGGVTLRRVGFLRRDSACSDKSLILRGGLAHYRLDKSLRPSLESSNFSSTILESQIEIRKQPKFHCEQIAPQNAVFSSKILESQSGKKNKHKLPNPTASDSKLESSFLSSLRADNGGAAIHKNKAQKVDSSLESNSALEIQAACKNLAQLLESIFDKTQMDCHDLPSKSRNDRENAQTLESTFEKNHDCGADAPFPSLRGDEIAEVIHKPTSSNNAQNNYSASAESMDSKETSANAERYPLFCHATATALARNDRENAPILKQSAKDSRIFAHNAQSAFDKNAARRQDLLMIF